MSGPRLLFVTNTARLGGNVGADAADGLLRLLGAWPAAVVVDIPETAARRDCVTRIRHALLEDGPFDGVVLVGGYDVVPSHRLDALGPALRRVLPPTPDPDDFIVWNDDIYGDSDGDGLPEVPVSRVPDCSSASLLRQLLHVRDPATPVTIGGSASAPLPGAARAGVRNRQRPYADAVFALLPGPAQLLTSAELVFDQERPYDLTADAVYIVLHGRYEDGSRQYGEDATSLLTAMTILNVPELSDAVVLCASCWGGLITDTTAMRARSGRKLPHRTPKSSIALAFLAKCARCFIGCTGSHYSPVEAPYAYNGAPLHQAFWRRLLAGSPPARALFEAKYRDFAPGIPHGQKGTVARACECKVLREFTCLGLGW